MLSVAWNDFIALLSHSSFFVLKNFFSFPYRMGDRPPRRSEGLILVHFFQKKAIKQAFLFYHKAPSR